MRCCSWYVSVWWENEGATRAAIGTPRQELGVAIKSLIGPNMEPLPLGLQRIHEWLRPVGKEYVALLPQIFLYTRAYPLVHYPNRLLALFLRRKLDPWWISWCRFTMDGPIFSRNRSEWHRSAAVLAHNTALQDLTAWLKVATTWVNLRLL